MEASTPQLSERKDARANRARILVAAREEFAAKGMDAEMKDVADRAGVGVGTLYRHFESRQRLIAAIIDEMRAGLLVRIRATVSNEAPEDAFRAMIHAGAETYTQFGAIMEIALAENLEYGHKDEFRALFDDLIRRAKEAGIFREDLDSGVLFGALEALFSSGKLFEFVEERGPIAAVDVFADLFLRGCRASPAG
jgi:AcrR family transcriptional regulator